MLKTCKTSVAQMDLLFHRGTATLDKRRENYVRFDHYRFRSAGLSAAVYGKRAGLNLLIIEEKPMSGGQILNTYEVDNYLGLPGISGFDMGMTFRHHAEKLGSGVPGGYGTQCGRTRRLQMRLCGQPGTGDPYGDFCHRCGTCQIREYPVRKN